MSYNIYIYKDKESKEAYLCKLDKIFTNFLIDPNPIVIISNMSIRNNVAMFILHIYSYTNGVKKTIHYTINVTSTEAKLFAIRCRINQAIQIPKASYIIVITDVIYSVKHIFNSTIHSY